MKNKFEPDHLVRKIILDDHEIENLQKALYFLKGVELATPNSQYMHSVISEVIESVDYVVRQYWNAPHMISTFSSSSTFTCSIVFS